MTRGRFPHYSHFMKGINAVEQTVEFPVMRYGDVKWPPWRLALPANRVFAKQLVHTNNKEISKDRVIVPLWGKHTSGGSVDSPHKGTVTWKMFPFGDVIMSKIDTIALVWRDCNGTGIFPVTWIRLTHWDMADNYRPHFHMHILEWIFLNFKFHCRKFVSNCPINNKSAFELGNGLAQIRRQAIT